LPSPNVPDGFTPFSYLKYLCYEAAQRRYGEVSNSVDNRLKEELRLIKKHNLAGFMLLYREIVLIARDISIEMGKSDLEEPIEIRSPGRGRGSSVAMLTGYLIGISHVDPLLYNLTLERFVPDDLKTLPDIDIDFPRSIREKLIPRIHEYFGPQFAVLTGMITRYKSKGILRDLGKVFGIPDGDISTLSKKIHNLGSFNIQLINTKKGPIPFEFNSRFSGTTSVRSKFGFNEPEFFIKDNFLKNKLNQKKIKIKKGNVLRYIAEKVL